MSGSKYQHPALQSIIAGNDVSAPDPALGDWMTTSQTLARALAVGGLSRLDPSLESINLWDPAAGSGYAASMIVDALTSAGFGVRYRGQDINERAVEASRLRFAAAADAEIVSADTLSEDAFAEFRADLVIVDAPWGLSWREAAVAVRSRRDRGEFRFGLPQQSDSTWLFISLALEKLRPASDGGGRVAALVNPGALIAGGNSALVRQAILDAGLVESVTRLPEGLAPNTDIPLYLLTLTNRAESIPRNRAMIADLQTQFATEHGRRSMPLSAFQELESGLRTGKPGPRNRTIETRRFTRRDATLVRTSSDGHQLSWQLTTFNDTAVDVQLLEARYGLDSGVALDGVPRETVDLDPSRILQDDSRDVLKDLDTKKWSSMRLSGLLAREPGALKNTTVDEPTQDLFIPTTRSGLVSTSPLETESDGRVLSIRLDGERVHTGFLVAWLNSEQGVSSRRRAIQASSTGSHWRALRSDPSSLMRWADELIIPVPPHTTQIAVASADEQLASFQADLSTRRSEIWAAPENASEIVGSVAHAFDDTLSAWFEALPFPVATALWVAETASTASEKHLAYLHAWEALVAFHATVLLSAIRSVPGNGPEVESAIRRTLHEHNLGIGRATFGTWVVISEKTSSDIRRALASGDGDELARISRAFADLGQIGIERLVSTQVVGKFSEVNRKRNRWLGHSGITSDEDREAQIASLISDLRELRQLLGNVWEQLVLVRAGSLDRGRGGYEQSVEVALGTKSPFRRRVLSVGDPMVRGELYLVREGAQSPLHLLQFVQLRAAPRDARYTSYFYNRTEGSSVRLISYQHGPESELRDDVESLREDFGRLAQE